MEFEKIPDMSSCWLFIELLFQEISYEAHPNTKITLNSFKYFKKSQLSLNIDLQTFKESTGRFTVLFKKLASFKARSFIAAFAPPNH